MNAIFRTNAPVGELFKAPSDVTFGFQSARGEFSVWHPSDAIPTDTYLIVGTGHEFADGELVATTVLPDGFMVFHLIRVAKV